MTKQNEASRRLFLKQAAAISSMMVFPTILTKAMSGTYSPAVGLAGANERVNLACVGIGNQGGSDVFSLYNTGFCNVVAVCDTDMGAPQDTEGTRKISGCATFPRLPKDVR